MSRSNRPIRVHVLPYQRGQRGVVAWCHPSVPTGDLGHWRYFAEISGSARLRPITREREILGGQAAFLACARGRKTQARTLILQVARNSLLYRRVVLFVYIHTFYFQVRMGTITD